MSLEHVFVVFPASQFGAPGYIVEYEVVSRVPNGVLVASVDQTRFMPYSTERRPRQTFCNTLEEAEELLRRSVQQAIDSNQAALQKLQAAAVSPLVVHTIPNEMNDVQLAGARRKLEARNKPNAK